MRTRPGGQHRSTSLLDRFGAGALGRLGIASVRAHKARFAATALSIVLTVAFATATFVMSATAHEALADDGARQYATTDLVVRASSSITATFLTERAKIPATLVDVVADVPGVEAALAQVTTTAQVLDDDGRPVGGNGRPTIATNWLGDHPLNPYHLVEGRAPSAAEEIVLDQATARRIDAGVGDPVSLLHPAGPGTARLVGIARLGSSSGAAGATVVQVIRPTIDLLTGDADHIDTVVVDVADGADPNEVARQIRAALASPEVAEAAPALEVVDRAALVSEATAAPDLGTRYLRLVLVALTVLASLVSLLVIANVFGVVVGQRTREIALLRTVGAGRTQVGALVVIEALIVGAGASAIGVVGGVVLSRVVVALLGDAGVNLPSGPLAVPWRAVVVPAALGLAATVLGAMRAVVRAAQVAPLAPLGEFRVNEARLRRRSRVGSGVGAAGLVVLAVGARGANLVVLGVGGALVVFGAMATAAYGTWSLARAAAEGERDVPLAVSLGFGNLARSPARAASSATALGLGVMLVVTVAVLGSSASASLDASIKRQFRGDFVLQNRNLTGGAVPLDVAARLRADPSVSAVAEVRVMPAEIGDSTTVVAAVDGTRLAELMDLDVTAGRIDTLDEDAIALSTRAADELDVEVGDVVDLGFAHTGAQPLTVVGLYNDDALVGRYLVDLATYDANVTRPVDTLLLVRMVPGPSVNDRKQSIQRAIMPYYPAVAVLDVGRYRQAVARQISQSLGLVTVLLALAVAVAIAGVANTLVLSVYERRREIGLLRAVGMTREQSRTAVVVEAVAITTLGTIAGILLALVGSLAITHALRADGLEVFSVPWRGVVIVAVGAVGAGVGAALLPARRIGRLDVLTVLDDR